MAQQYALDVAPCQSDTESLRRRRFVPTFEGMIMAPQGMAEYVALNASRAASFAGSAFRNAVAIASDNFLVVVGIMVAIVLLYTFSLSSPR